VAIRCLSLLPAKSLIKQVAPQLTHPVRLVRIEAADALAAIPSNDLKLNQLKAFTAAFDELRTSHLVNADLAGAHMMLGVLDERSGRAQAAIQQYLTAVHVQPDVAGPRSNLAQLLDRMNDAAGARRWRAEELPLLRRDALLTPNHATTQYRYGLSLYLDGQEAEALPLLARAAEIEPSNVDYQLALALLNERLGHNQAALRGIQTVRQLRPHDPQLIPIEQRLKSQLQPSQPRAER
jgi:Flp pilus assembly protein TadD